MVESAFWLVELEDSFSSYGRPQKKQRWKKNSFQDESATNTNFHIKKN